MSPVSPGAARPLPADYRWIVLSNTTIGMLLATINASILLIALGAPFSDALSTAFSFSFIACLVAAWASWLRGGKYHYREDPEPEAVAPLAADGQSSSVGAPRPRPVTRP